MRVSMRAHLFPLGSRLFVLLSCLALATAPLTASPSFIEQGKLLAADEALRNKFGTSVAVSGDTAIVGAPDASNMTGAAYIFVRNGAGWSQQARLVPSNAVPDLPCRFGVSVAISGETAVVGSYVGNPDFLSGAAYVFVRNGSTWSEQARLVAPDAFRIDLFGTSVAIDGDTIVVGAPNSDSTPTVSPRGAVYVFVRNGTAWSFQAKLLASDGNASDSFGYSVAIAGDTLAVGSPLNNTATGAVYVFRRSGAAWQEQRKLRASNGSYFEYFGLSTSISGNTLVAGAPGQRFFTTDVGAAYVFVDDGSDWFEQATLLASDGVASDGFGWTAAISGDTVVVGAVNHSASRGKAYVFVRQGSIWSERARLFASDRKAEDLFGVSVALSEGTVLVGAEMADDPGVAQDIGAAYLFPGAHVAPTALLVTQNETPLTVSLETEPAGDVVIDVASSDTNEGTVFPTRLTFTPSDWSTPQTVSLTRVAGSGLPYTIALSMNQELTGDAFYDGLDPEDVSALPLEFTGDFYTVPPCRVLDTRLPGHGPPLTGGVHRVVAFHDACGVSVTARAVAIAVTVVQPTRGGHLTLYPSDLPCPGLDQLTFSAGRSRTISTIVPLASDGTGTLTAASLVADGGSTHLVIDLAGYFE